MKADLWRFPDRTTQTGQKIDAYLKNTSDMDDAVIHQLFADNRWEKKWAILHNLSYMTSMPFIKIQMQKFFALDFTVRQKACMRADIPDLPKHQKACRHPLLR